MAERQVWINGRMMPESQGFISFRDLGIIYGEGVFDTARTFGGRLFRLGDHIDRLYDSLAYARIDPRMTKAEMTAVTEEVLAANLPVLRPGEDYWVTQRVTAGIRALDGEPQSETGPTVMIECAPLPLRARARYFRDGIDAVTATASQDRARCAVATRQDDELSEHDAGAGRRGRGASGGMGDPAGPSGQSGGRAGEQCVFCCKAEGFTRPSDDYVLAGVSRQVVIDICGSHQIPLLIGDVTPAMAAAADEAFFTSTSLCACPVRSLDGRVLPGGAPGPVTKRIMDAFAAEAGFDFVAQYLAFLSDAPAQGGI